MDVKVYACSLAAKYVPTVIDLLNKSGPKPAAVTIGGAVFYFVEPNERLKRHEQRHIEQQARRCPWYLRFLPVTTRAWIGLPKFAVEYIREEDLNGYAGNKFEVEARAAENA